MLKVEPANSFVGERVIISFALLSSCVTSETSYSSNPFTKNALLYSQLRDASQQRNQVQQHLFHNRAFAKLMMNELSVCVSAEATWQPGFRLIRRRKLTVRATLPFCQLHRRCQMLYGRSARRLKQAGFVEVTQPVIRDFTQSL